MDLAHDAHERGEYLRAISLLSKALDVDDGRNTITILTLRANSFNSLGDHDSTIRDCSIALKLCEPPLGIPGVMRVTESGNAICVSDLDVTNALILRANAYLELGRLVEAQEDIEAVLQIEPDNEQARYLKSVLASLITAMQ